MTNLLSLDEARNLTAEMHPAWIAAHESAMDELNRAREASPSFFVPLEQAELCATMHRHIYQRAAHGAAQGVISTERVGFCAQIINGLALVRFKHLHADLSPRAYATEQQRHLDRQEYSEEMMAELRLDGVAVEPTLLTVGYHVNPEWNEVARVSVVCWYRGKLLYYFDIGRTEESRATEELPLPGMPPAAARVVSKRGSSRETTQGEV